MTVNGFMEGNIRYHTSTISPGELAAAISGHAWQGGFIAFSRGEKLLADVGARALSAGFLRERSRAFEGAEGYVTEVNLWRCDGGIVEEIAAEREDDAFFVQQWRLESVPDEGTGNCWHRPAKTEASSRLFRGKLDTVEVVWPEYRLSFFITMEGSQP